jgi:uncharacterized caspase-like protein
MGVYAAKHGETALDGEGADSPFAIAVAGDVREPRREVRKLFDIVRDDVWEATKPASSPSAMARRPDARISTVTATAQVSPATTEPSQNPPAKK